MNISSIGQIFQNSEHKAGSNNKIQVPFSELFKEAVQSINDTEKFSMADNIDLLTDGEISLHDIMIKAEKADIALQFTLQMRNKVIEAYNEVMRMQI